MRKLKSVIFFTAFFVTSISYPVNGQDYEWAVSLGKNVIPAGVTTDTYGNSFVTGTFEGETKIGTSEIISRGLAKDIFLAKFDKKGKCIWLESAGGSYDDEGFGIAVDKNGNIYITGYITEKAYFGDFTIESEKSTVFFGRSIRSIFVAKYNNSGGCVWAVNNGIHPLHAGYRICLDSLANCYVTGTAGFLVKGDYGNSNNTDILLMKLNNQGQIDFSNSLGSDQHDRGMGIVCDERGNFYIAGQISNRTVFGGIQFGGGSNDIYLAKIDTRGKNILWKKTAGGDSDSDEGKSISMDGNGNVYVVGTMSDTAIFGEKKIAGNGKIDGFLAKFTNLGEVKWVKIIGGTDDDYIVDVVSDVVGNSFLTGYFKGTIKEGNAKLTSSGESDIFFAKFDSNGENIYIKKFGSKQKEYAKAISLDTDGNVFLTGHTENKGSMVLGRYKVNSGGFLIKISNKK